MQFKTVVLSLFVALAAADSLDDLAAQIPSCAKTCIDDGAKKAGCASTDYTCECSNITSITANAFSCVSSSCSADDLQKTTDATTSLCLAVAQQVGGDAYSSAINSLTSAAGSALSSATAAVGSATGSAGSAFTSATAAAGSSLTSAATGASPTATPAAANQAVAGMGMVGAAAMFALAL
ncbi:hypothetical protein F5Y09DRAFT_315713 [Xylaria sp. FL1042]|nr:hypothetical protein F5Y09DRAFT_315713 [Xylaria sp. FL1042]